MLDRDKATCQQLKKDLPALHGYSIADAADPESVERAYSEWDGLAKDLDVLINNAGTSIRNSKRVAA